MVPKCRYTGEWIWSETRATVAPSEMPVTKLRRGLRITLAVAIAAAAGALIGAPQALAKSQTSTSLTVKGSKGYKVEVIGFDGNPVFDRHVMITATNDDGGLASYTAKGKVSDEQMKARFKGFGKVALEFDPKGRPKRDAPPKGCKGPDTVIQSGTWEGKLVFRGENSYTKVSERKVKGTVTKRGELKCDIPGGGFPPSNCLALNSNATDVFFGARERNQGGAQFSATALEKKGRVEIRRSVTAVGQAGSFTANVEAGTASVNPPSPFSGSATVENGTLNGSLSVELPGKTVDLGGLSAQLFDNAFCG